MLRTCLFPLEGLVKSTAPLLSGLTLTLADNPVFLSPSMLASHGDMGSMTVTCDRMLDQQGMVVPVDSVTATLILRRLLGRPMFSSRAVRNRESINTRETSSFLVRNRSCTQKRPNNTKMTLLFFLFSRLTNSRNVLGSRRAHQPPRLLHRSHTRCNRMGVILREPSKRIPTLTYRNQIQSFFFRLYCIERL